MAFRLHLKNFQSIREATLDIAPLTFLAGPNAAGKSAVADALGILSLNFGKAVSGMSWEDVPKYMRSNDAELVVGLGCNFEWSDRAFNAFDYLRMPFYTERTQVLIDQHGNDLFYSREAFESGDVLFYYAPDGREKIDIYLNGALAIRCANLDSGYDELVFLLENPAVKRILAERNIERLIREEVSDVIFSEDRIIVHACISRVEGKFGIQMSSLHFNEGYALFAVLEYLVNALIHEIAAHGSAYSFEQKVTQDLVHIGPLRAIPKQDEWLFQKPRIISLAKSPVEHLDEKAAMRGLASSIHAGGWHDGQRAWIGIAECLVEQARRTSSERMSISWKEGESAPHLPGVSINTNKVKVLEQLNSLLCGEPLRLGYRIVGEVAVRLPVSGDKPPYTPEDIINADHVVSLRVEDAFGRRHRLSDVGVGISQLVPVLYAGLTNHFAIIEQPELHLHPRLQLELASFFIEQISENRHFILETHSENVFLRVLRAIRETSSSDILHRRFNLKPEQVSVLYFDRQGDSTEVMRLRISEDGEFIDSWPGGFFAEREAELF